MKHVGMGFKERSPTASFFQHMYWCEELLALGQAPGYNTERKDTLIGEIDSHLLNSLINKHVIKTWFRTLRK